ncbi:MAG: hypothetical protein ABSH05_21950 [Bryobacteraceae bacterium]|jgi:hypothetical protein
MEVHTEFITVWLGIAIMACGSLIAQNDTRREIRLHFERAQTALKASQLETAADEFRQILRLDPKSAAAHANVSLQKVERDFRQMKTGLLEVRPVFVRKESRTRGHIFCCLLALKLSREIERRLQVAFGTTDQNPHAVTTAGALAALSRLCLLEYPVDEKTTLPRLPKPDARQKEILKALAIQLPEQ